MEPIQPQRRRHERSDDSPIIDRPSSSLAMIATRVHAVREAFQQQDEMMLRSELLALSDECKRMASQPEPIDSPLLAAQAPLADPTTLPRDHASLKLG